MLTANTCNTCKDSQCNIRENCPDDETSTEQRLQVYAILPTIKTEPQLKKGVIS